jgi:hypothetical protein
MGTAVNKLGVHSIILLSASLGALWAQGTITTFAGRDWLFSGDGKPAVDVPIGGFLEMSVSPQGDVYAITAVQISR